MQKPYDWSADVTRLTMPVMLIYGDSDMYPPRAHREILPAPWRWTEGCRLDAREHVTKPLAIIPNRTHYDMFFAPELATTVLPFLNDETNVKSWDDLVKGK